MHELLANELATFERLHGALQAVYIFYLCSGFLLPFAHARQAKKFRAGTSGVGDTCLRSLAWAAFCRTAPLLYSFTVIWSFPLFLSVALDLIGRIWVIVEAFRARHRQRLTLSTAEAAVDETQAGPLGQPEAEAA